MYILRLMVFHDDGLVTIETCNEGSNRNVHPPIYQLANHMKVKFQIQLVV